MNCCIFCLRHRTRFEGELESSCTYKAAHELEDGTTYSMTDRGLMPVETTAPKPKQAKKKDAKLCKNCGLHPKNPVFSTNGCAHAFESDTEEPTRSQGTATDARTEGASNTDPVA